MLKKVLFDMLAQNRASCSYTFNRITNENKDLRLNEKTASIGFIYRHIGETINMFGLFFGVETDIKSTTMGQTDTGKDYDLESIKILIENGYEMFNTIIDTTPDSGWLDQVDTPFFGSVSKARVFSHVLYHNAHHAGQISMTLERGSKQNSD